MIKKTIRDRYFLLLRTCLASSEETELNEAVELGRDLMLAKVPLREIAKMHEEALLRLANEAPEVTLSDAVRSTTAPLTELITAYNLALWESEDRFRQFFENAPEYCYMISPEGVILSVNNTALKALGYKKDELVGKPLRTIYASELLPRMQELFEKWKRTGKLRNEELVIITKEGDSRNVLLSADVVKGKDGEVLHSVSIQKDITERKKKEAELRKRTHDLSERIKELNCLYGIAHIVEKPGISFEEICQGVVEIIPISWQYPEITCARIVLEDQIYKTNDFEETDWKQSSDILVHGERIGCVDIFYLEERPKIDEGPFLKEERNLLDGIAERLGKITEQKRAEKKLRESEENYRELADSITDIFFATDKNLIFIYWNKASEEMTGIKAEDALGKSFFEIFPDREDTKGTKKIVAIYREVLKTQQSQTFVNEYAVHNINYFFEISVYPTKDGLAVFTKNITERKRMEEALRESEERYKSISDVTVEGLIVHDKGVLVDGNSALAKMFGYELEELIGKNLIDQVATPGSWEIIRRNIAAGITTPYEIEVRRKDGTVFPVEVEGRDVYYRGKPLRVSAVRDITERKRMEEELREKERLATIGEVAAGLAHEIRNPLFAISSGIQVLQYGSKLDEAQKETFDIIFKETMRVDRLIRQLLGFTIRQELKLTTFQITTLIDEVISLNEDLLRFKGIKIRMTLPGDIPPVYADRDRIIQVLVNILQNAIDVSRRDDTIRIACGIDGERQCVTIKVQDRGPGIPKYQREMVFVPFFSTKKGSSGVGLAISKKIIQEHGGRIRVEPREKKGTTFVVELPLLRPATGGAQDK